jgi:two-component system chemotaxis response regulator CheY
MKPIRYEEAGVNLKELCILIIDDSPFIRTVVKKILRGMGVKKIFEAGNGVDGMKIAIDEKPDAILCDLGMEPMNGFEFVETLRTHKQKAVRDLPVIILTVHDETDFIDQAIQCGVEAYLIKPVSARRLKERIEEVVGKRHQ